VCYSNKFIYLHLKLFCIYQAAQCGHVNVIELLIKNGINKELEDKINATPLHIGNYLIKCILSFLKLYHFNEAAKNGHVNFIEALIKSGAYKGQKDKKNATPLFIGNNINTFISIKFKIFFLN